MTKQDLPTPELLRKLLRYMPSTGKLYWLSASSSEFSDTQGRTAEHTAALWMSKYSGKEAFINQSNDGYRRGRILGQGFQAHRVIWAMHYGEWPKDEIDHINHIRTDNRIENLRVVTHQDNGRNISMPNTNTSGIIGVCWLKDRRRWRAVIMVDGKSIYLGCFKRRSEAAAAREVAEKKHGFHYNHGTTT